MIDTFVCTECGNIFEELKACHGELLEHFGTPCRESWPGSPCCESNYTEAYECEECGEYITSEEYAETISGLRFCKECYQIKELGSE